MSWLKRNTSKPTSPVLEGVSASGQIRGMLLTMEVEQRFCNTSGHSLEMVYGFPLPYAAQLLETRVQLGERQLHGKVVEKATAQQTYEQAIAEGDTAIVLERNADQSYTLNLGNLAPGERCIVRFSYAQQLCLNQGNVRVMIPTVIAPRFGDPVQDGGLKPHQVREHDLLVEYPFTLSLTLHEAWAGARFNSPSHTLQVKPGALRTELALANVAALDRDFVLVLDQAQQQHSALLAVDPYQPSQSVLMASFLPQLAQAAISTSIQIKLLVDCSGSMQGDSMQSARQALAAILDSLQDGDLFSLSRFGDQLDHWSPRMRALGNATRSSAQHWLRSIEADMGGTQLARALHEVMALESSADDGGQVLLITDGEIESITGLIQTARQSGHTLFIVGIGSSPAESHLRRLAEATGGACEFVAPGEDVEPAILRMFHRLRSPKFNAPSVIWPEGCMPIWQQALPERVFANDVCTLFALFEQTPTGDIRLQAMQDGQPVALAQLSIRPADNLGRTLAQLAAARRHSDQTTGSDQAKSLACQYGLISDDSQFLLVHERAEADKASDMPTLFKVPQMVPAGWSGNGTVTRSARQHTIHASTDADLNAPAVFRSVRRPVRIYDADADIPAFLRSRSDSEITPQPSALDKIARLFGAKPNASGRHSEQLPSLRLDDSHNWCNGQIGGSLSPLGFSRYLQNMRFDQWPSRCDQLPISLLPAHVATWLESLADKDSDEGAILSVFCRALTHKDVSDALETQLCDAIAEINWLTVIPHNHRLSSDQLNSIIHALRTLSPTDWGAMAHTEAAQTNLA